MSDPEAVRSGEPAIRVDDVSVRFGGRGNGTLALDGITLSVRDGEFLCLVGPSGCGKSTLLNVMAGLARPTTGSADTGGRRIGMMFQDATLFPWLTVEGNISLALRLSGVPRRDRAARVTELLDLVRLPGARRRRPHELSGGMRQRVALARALAQDCQILLMDEPFGALDAITRDAMHDETERIWRERGLTVVFVTHNVQEAARLGDRVVVMAAGPGRIHAVEPVDLPRPRQMDDLAVATAAARLHHMLRPGEKTVAHA